MGYVSPHSLGSATDSFEKGSGGVRNLSQLIFMSWNIEGLSLLKETGIIDYMFRFDVDVCCLQETNRSKSDVFDCNGYEFILSGSSDGPTDWCGVGFVIFPRLRHHRRGFSSVK